MIVQGYVREKTTRNLIEGATVTLSIGPGRPGVQPPGNDLEIAVLTTGRGGFFRLQRPLATLPPGQNLTIRVDHPDHRQQRRFEQVAEQVDLDIELERVVGDHGDDDEGESKPGREDARSEPSVVKTEPDTVVISGVVVSNAEGDPVDAAEVALLVGDIQVATLQTRHDGSFNYPTESPSQLPLGETLRLRVTHPKYKPGSESVKLDSNRIHRSVRLVPPPPAISGSVFDERNNAAIEGAVVTMIAGGHGLPPLRTDENGFFRYQEAPGSEWPGGSTLVVRVTSPGYSPWKDVLSVGAEPTSLHIELAKPWWKIVPAWAWIVLSVLLGTVILAFAFYQLAEGPLSKGAGAVGTIFLGVTITLGLVLHNPSEFILENLRRMGSFAFGVMGFAFSDTAATRAAIGGGDAEESTLSLIVGLGGGILSAVAAYYSDAPRRIAKEATKQEIARPRPAGGSRYVISAYLIICVIAMLLGGALSYFVFFPPYAQLQVQPRTKEGPGDPATLSWSSRWAWDCIGHNGFETNGAIYGEASIEPEETTTYALKCTTYLGQSTNDMVTVSVTPVDDEPTPPQYMCSDQRLGELRERFKVPNPPPSFCKALDIVDSLPDRRGLSLTVPKGDWIEGQLLTLTFKAPDFNAYISIDYLTSDGKVLHVRQPVPGLVPKGATRRPRPGFEASAPFTPDMALMIASGEPFWNEARPRWEPAIEYLKQLEVKIDTAKGSYRDVAAEARFVYPKSKTSTPKTER